MALHQSHREDGATVGDLMVEPAHLYLWVPNALLPEGLRVMTAWGFDYKSNIVQQTQFMPHAKANLLVRVTRRKRSNLDRTTT
jgi:N6-adenosine-specific RNA methylase IME4